MQSRAEERRLRNHSQRLFPLRGWMHLCMYVISVIMGLRSHSSAVLLLRCSSDGWGQTGESSNFIFFFFNSSYILVFKEIWGRKPGVDQDLLLLLHSSVSGVVLYGGRGGSFTSFRHTRFYLVYLCLVWRLYILLNILFIYIFINILYSFGLMVKYIYY